MNSISSSRWVKWSLFALATVAIGYAIWSSFPRNEEGGRVGDTAPSFSLSGLDGETIRLTDYRGKGIIINFWASWCKPCTNEMPLMNEAYAESPDVEIIAINVGEKPEKAKRFAEELGLKFPVALDQDNEIKKKYRISGLPVTLLVDKDGKIVERITGELQSTQDILDLMDEVRQDAS
ncbi:thiol-disulfide oxidoreductase ResA [Paenibacillus sp. L3-i20]|uniref:thiol-disulfide oxidoreductase ResA n=1 Tax=Paenibacillus sp. L3-i20 TaxID=2905833 RepID=UPI001EDDA6BE|nr:thiol-disulfide oxidoreductase ResA [Paenibacillus sp. L3-i20]GKU79401.1 thiol-disulfide oxidoreductase ResA [Paenibacillus sp. L3-i20]